MNFSSNCFWSPVSCIVQRKVKEGPWGIFEHPFFSNIEKMKGAPFGDNKKICEKSLTKPKKPAQKILVKGGSPTHVLLLGRPQKAATSMPSASRSSVAQFSVSASQLIKLKKSVSSLVSKSHYYSLQFSTKEHRLKRQFKQHCNGEVNDSLPLLLLCITTFH